MKMIDRTLGIGILGCSDIARRRFLPGLLRAANAKLVACASRTVEKARQFFPGTDYDAVSYDDLLRHELVNAVYISVPNHLHEEWALKALAAGKHVICEKPLGLTLDSVKRMTAFAESQGLLLFENIMYVHHPQHRMIREIVARGDIGRLRSFRSSFGFLLAAPGDFRLSSGPGGGAFNDQARYPLSAARYHLAGALRDVTGYRSYRRGVNVSLQASGMSTEGESFFCSIGFEQQYECWYELIGDKGKIRLERAYTTPADHAGIIEVTTGSQVNRIETPRADHFQLTIEHAAGLILGQQDFSRAHEAARRLAADAELLWSGCRSIVLEE
ncbi:MAG: Gfo/Idh/MocA family oxidoreductase [Nitrospirota bacterium]|nr:Gfo/Idh/MocA family oxidoreductase [Nitrospirota bacterium]